MLGGGRVQGPTWVPVAGGAVAQLRPGVAFTDTFVFSPGAVGSFAAGLNRSTCAQSRFPAKPGWGSCLWSRSGSSHGAQCAWGRGEDLVPVCPTAPTVSGITWHPWSATAVVQPWAGLVPRSG